ncbi:MAG: hypothetical protein V3V59_09365, partial [Thermodesulfovibrionales bacterium]
LSLSYFVRSLLYKAPLYNAEEKSRQVSEDAPVVKILKSDIEDNDIVTKNIFHPDREYVDSSAEEGSDVESDVALSPMPTLTVKGIVERPDGEYIAYISREGKLAQPVHAGDRIENLKVVSITRTDVTIRWNNSDVKLSLKKVRSVEKKR